MRSAVLHLGSSIPDASRDIKSQYAAFSFVDPDNWPQTAHNWRELDASGGMKLTVDIAELAGEMLSALRNWFNDVTTNPDLEANVACNLDSLVRIQPKTVHRPLPGQTVLLERSVSTSSTGSVPTIKPL